MKPLCTLDDWLAHVEKLHEKPIDLGLDRMKLMIERMGIRFECPVVTVAGTNGKGSTCAMIERICRAAGLRTGMHTSPHLIRFNERALLCGREASDEALVECLKEVEDARRGLSLSYFEFTGLAILRLFQKSALDVVVLEIGLGGRLDAINAVDPDVSVICAVGIDHTAFLGSTREAIGLEKAHIYRSGRPAICADPEPPVTIPEYAREIGAHYLAAGRDFDVKAHADGTFDFIFGEERIEGLPRPALVGRNQYRNAAGALAAVMELRGRLPIDAAAVSEGLRSVRIPARFERVREEPCPTILDVGHNPNAAEALVVNLADTKLAGERTLAVFGMLVDKDRPSVIRIVKPEIDHWFASGIPGPRGTTTEEILASLVEGGVERSAVTASENPVESLAKARDAARKMLADAPDRPVRIIVFGSFVTVTAVMEALAAEG